MPVLNKRFYLLKLIRSIQNQKYENAEIVFVDDHSTDGSIELSNEEGIANGSIASGSDRREGVFTRLSDFNPIFTEETTTVQPQAITVRYFITI